MRSRFTFLQTLFLSGFLLFPSFSRLRAEGAVECPSARRVAIDLDGWVRRARAVKTPEQLDAALDKIGVSALSSRDGEPVCKNPAIRRLQIDHFRTELSPGVKSNVIQILVNLCSDAGETSYPWESQQGMLLVPLAKNLYCRVDMPVLNQKGSAWGETLCNPTIFRFENLTSSSYKVVRVTEHEEWCGGAGSDRGSKTTVSWWELQDWKLVSILKAVTDEFYYHSPTPPIRKTSTSIQKIGKGYPRELRLTEKITCEHPHCEDGDDFCKSEVESCTPGTTIRRCSYQNRIYSCNQNSK